MQPDTTILNDVLQIVTGVLASSDQHPVNVSLVDADTDLRDVLGFDSLAMMHVLSTLEQEFGVLLDDDQAISSATSVRSLAAFIQQRMKA